MAATSVCASSTSAVTSADITIVAGTPATLSLNGTPMSPDAQAVIQLKNSSSTYDTVGFLNTDPANRARVVDGPGVYRVVKGAAALAFGVDQS